MEGFEEQECDLQNQRKFYFYLRNVCSPILAKLLAKELKNSNYIKETLTNDRENKLKTLYDILKKASSKGKKKADKKKPAEKSDGGSKTHHINNLEVNESILSQVQICELVHEREGEVHEESSAAKKLGELDWALLLNILTNVVLEFPLLGIEREINILKEIRNSISHNNDLNMKDVKPLREAVELVYKHMGIDINEKRCHCSSPQSSCFSVMKELQQEIHESYTDSLPNHNYTMQPTIKHLRRDCQSDEIVENLVNFVKERKACENQEPWPILLCGAHGAGKSTILHSLVHSFIGSEDFQLVVLLDENMSIDKTKECFWNHVYNHLMKLSPNTVERHGPEKVMTVLENYSSRFLFLWDLNLQVEKNPVSHMDQGTWVLSHQGLGQLLISIANCWMLKVDSLSEKQVGQILYSITNSDEHYRQVLECYNKCDYKGLINSPDMVHIFDSVCLGMTECAPSYKLIQMYIDSKIKRTEENNVELKKLGERAFHAIKQNRKYYPEKCLTDIQKNVYYSFLEQSPLKEYFFKYRVVEDYLAAWYVVCNPKKACVLWLGQATLFKRVFEIVCALWCERGRETICNNLDFVRKYLEKLFNISKPKQDRAEKPKNKQVVNENKAKEAVEVHGVDGKAKKLKNEQAMEFDDNSDDNRRKKQTDKQTMEVDEQVMEVDNQVMEVVDNKKDERKSKQQKNMQVMALKEDESDDTKQDPFLRWVFLSRIAKEHCNNEDILLLLADLLTCKSTWVFKCKWLKEVVIYNISLVLRHINLTKKLTIRLESGPNVTILSKLWNMLSSHQGVCCNTTVHLVIHHTESNWVMHEKLLAKLPSDIVNTKVPLHITKYVGPLVCSTTPHFLKCLCMAELEELDVYVCDLVSLCEVLAHQPHHLVSVIVRLHLKLEERTIPKTTQIQLSSSLPLTLTITYFENLQLLLEKFEPPALLKSLKICKVFIHENFKLDLRRFTKMESLFIRFVSTRRLPDVFLKTTESEDKMELSDENDIKTPFLPVEEWTFHLVLNLKMPKHLERFLMRNLSFCDDSKISLLSKYWEGQPFQRLILLDTHLSLSTFKVFLNPCIEDIRKDMKKVRLDATSSSETVGKQERLKKEEREERRQNKPEGNELIVTSVAQLCKYCCSLSCTCIPFGINNSRDTYEDLVSLAKELYSYKILNISYSGKDIIVRKDMCGDLQIQCPVPFLDDDTAQHPEGHPGLCQVLEALVLAQIICLNHTKLSHKGALHLIDCLKEKKKNSGTVEPFRLTILSHHYHSCCLSREQVQYSSFRKMIKDDASLKQFNFKCDCWHRCHNFKKTVNGKIYFNNIVLADP